MSVAEQPHVKVPFFRPAITEHEIAEVVACLNSGWLTTGPRVKKFETEFAQAVGARFAVAVNSCTAALHLAVEALGLRSGQGVLVPTMTFAATAEIVRYQGAEPILVDCDPRTLNMDLDNAERKLKEVRNRSSANAVEVVGMIPVHVGGLMMDLDEIRQFGTRHGLWFVEDAAHAFPAAFRATESSHWRRCGENSAHVSCFSFYTNKTITTGEGGMAVTDDIRLANRMRQMSLHGLSEDAWDRYNGNGSWDYRIVAPGYKYNLTDIAACLGIHQLKRADQMREERESLAQYYLDALGDVDELELPVNSPNRIHAWHLFPIRLRLERLSADRNTFMSALKHHGVGCSVHWRPLHLHPYYQEVFGYTSAQFPIATSEWQRLISLPLFPGMCRTEQEHIIDILRDLCDQFRTPHAFLVQPMETPVRRHVGKVYPK